MRNRSGEESASAEHDHVFLHGMSRAGGGAEFLMGEDEGNWYTPTAHEECDMLIECC